MENKSHALAAGTFVLVVLALLVSLAVWLTRDNRALQVYEITSQQAVTGLQPQASVRFKGVTVGKVTNIGFDPSLPGQVLVQIAIDDQAPITASTFASLGFQGVTGLAFIQLDDRGESKTMLPANPAKPQRIPLRPGLVSQLSDQGLHILSQLEESSRRVNLLLSPENQQKLMTAVGDLGLAANSVRQLSTRTEQLLPPLVLTTTEALKTMQATSLQVGDSADEARASARAFRTVTERMSTPGGTLDQLTQSASTLAAIGQSLNSATLPRLNRAVVEATHSANRVSRAADSLTDNPQSLIFGNGPPVPGPGEPGFATTPGKP
ncbi:MAG: MlaD family protein [Rhodoferax sp.]|uniref:MlaD family protein n=1 Tax=Rhodoferax sp. TaxID=50421 RepID=UPI00301A5AD7